LVNAKRRDGHSAQTVTHCRNMLRAALNHAVRWGLVSKRSYDGDVPRIKRPVIQAMSADKAKAILNGSKGTPFERFMPSRYPGVRVVANCLDCDGRISILTLGGFPSRALSRALKVVCNSPKSQNLKVAPHYPAATVRRPCLASARSWASSTALGSWAAVGGCESRVANRLGGFIEPVSIHRDFRRALCKTGLPAMKFHNLRHGAATLMPREGAPLKLIQELLGYSSIAVTNGSTFIQRRA
jgi:hypothetical protein